MKTYPGQRFGITQSLVISAWLVCAFLLARPNGLHAEPQNSVAEQLVKPAPPVQAVLGKARPRGPVFVAIPVAYQYGFPALNTAYCSPSIRATNSSNEKVSELIVGIEYMTVFGKPAGATVTRYVDIKIHRQETHLFYQLTVPDCTGLVGQMSILRCVYSTGEDCSSEVQAVGFGTIPLRLKSR